jgi:TRAP-type C4-dicarboxylate transport system substrate-binding protein
LNATDLRDLVQPGTRGRQILDEVLAGYNLKLLALWEGGTSGLVAYEALPTLDSLRGKKLRVATEVSGNMLRAAGGQVISMSGAEAPDAMRRRIIDASAIEPSGIKSRGYHDFAKYWMDWDVVPIAVVIMMHLEEWKRLPKEVQDVVWATAREVEEQADKAVQEAQAAALAEVTAKHGMTVIRVQPSEKDRLRTLGQTVINDAIGRLTPPAQVQEFVKLMEGARAKKRK